MNTVQLRLFLTIARHRSLSRAAAELGLGLATVSERLQALEGEVGAALFTRQRRGVLLTPAGEAFLAYAERALEILREGQTAAQSASQGERGQVTIAATVTSGAYLLGPALARFQARHPAIDVRVRSAHSWDAPGLLLDGLADLALVSGPPLNPQLETLAVFTRPLVVAAGRAHPRAGQTFSLAQLAQENWIVTFWGPAAQRFLEQVRAAAPAGGGGRWQELSPVELVKGMLMAGSRVSLLPEIAAQREITAGELAALALDESVPRRPAWEISLLRRRGGAPRPAAEALAATLIAEWPAR
ncbi:MAG: LysR family transcriptional regulator [Anaerolineales bacterium]|nr:LysR family transcriptional regulator [Anaerolineales bacterium]